MDARKQVHLQHGCHQTSSSQNSLASPCTAMHYHVWFWLTCSRHPSRHHLKLTDLSAAQLSMELQRRGALLGQSSFLRLLPRPVPHLAQASHKVPLAELQSPLPNPQTPARFGQLLQQHSTSCCA